MGEKSERRVVEEARSPLALDTILDSARTAFAPYHLRIKATHPTTIEISTYLDSLESLRRVLSDCDTCALICLTLVNLLYYQVLAIVGHEKLMPRATPSKPLGAA
jgi:hypothetical protein